MVECQKCLDPTAMGLFLVAVVSFPLAIANLIAGAIGPSPVFFEAIGLLIIFVAILAYRADANFGFVVFGLVGAAVALTGFGIGPWENIAFAITFVLAIIWSICAKTPKNLSLILVTTALIFLFVGLSNPTVVGGDYWPMLIGIVALANFLLNVYLAFALALEDKLPVF